MRFDPAECPECGEEDWQVLHEAHPGAPRSDATLKCGACGHTLRGAIEWPKEIPLRCVVSQGRASRVTTLPWPGDQRLRVGDEAMLEGHRVLVTSIEHNEGKRVRTAPPESVKAVWAKVFDIVHVRASINLGPTSESAVLERGPDEPIHVGETIEVSGRQVRVDHIKTRNGIVHRGAIPARDVVRLYAKPADAPKPESLTREGSPPGRPRRL